jgi:hypothetical protein
MAFWMENKFRIYLAFIGWIDGLLDGNKILHLCRPHWLD